MRSYSYFAHQPNSSHSAAYPSPVGTYGMIAISRPRRAAPTCPEEGGSADNITQPRRQRVYTLTKASNARLHKLINEHNSKRTMNWITLHANPTGWTYYA